MATTSATLVPRLSANLKFTGDEAKLLPSKRSWCHALYDSLLSVSIVETCQVKATCTYTVLVEYWIAF